MILALAVLVGYLLGSIPFGLLLTKAAGAPADRQSAAEQRWICL